MKNKEYIQVISILLAVHLLICNTKLLWTNAETEMVVMKFIWGLVAMANSALSAISITKISKFGYILPFALLDSWGVLIEKYHYNEQIGWYFAIYMFIAIIMGWLAIHKQEESTAEEENPKEIAKAKDQLQVQPQVQPQSQPKELPQQTDSSLTYDSVMNRIKGKLKGGPTPEKKTSAMQLALQLPIAEDKQKVIEYINNKF